MLKKSRLKFKYLENKMSFEDEVKNIFHHVWTAIIEANKKVFLEGERQTLKYKSNKFSWIYLIVSHQYIIIVVVSLSVQYKNMVCNNKMIHYREKGLLMQMVLANPHLFIKSMYLLVTNKNNVLQLI